ncbi:helix-turn-helix transcriptional regulator [uncultured Sneathia sp.]|uniref:helix-turn-helix domain-containing protein n=1 Tax=uncultured Sneathia sp. TaxID=278067 RepID=UPI00259B8158|nr:helix-turn-helix transcriptional regulator [uncultured Sneathia sp.]
MDIGQKLKKMRVENNMTMLELSEIFSKKYNAKIDITTISKLEHNKLSANNKYLGYYADYFGVSYEWLQNDEQTRQIVKNAMIQSLMTYKKFKKKIEEMGLVCDYSYYVISVFDPDYNPLAYVNQTTINSMSTISTVSRLSETTSNKLLTLCYELARTPIDER